MKQYTVQITDKALADMELLKNTGLYEKDREGTFLTSALSIPMRNGYFTLYAENMGNKYNK